MKERYIPLYVGATRHPKIRALAKRLGVSRREAFGIKDKHLKRVGGAK